MRHSCLSYQSNEYAASVGGTHAGCIKPGRCLCCMALTWRTPPAAMAADAVQYAYCVCPLLTNPELTCGPPLMRQHQGHCPTPDPLHACEKLFETHGLP